MIIFAGCGTKEAVKNLSDEEVLKERIGAYWNHKINREFNKSYAYEDPFFRKDVDETRYSENFKRSKAAWVSAVPETITIDKDSAVVDMKIRIKISRTSSDFAEQDAIIKEKWTKIDNVWYHVTKKGSGVSNR